MTRTVELETRLECTPDEAWERVQSSALLDHIASPLIRFIPRPKPFPTIWGEGEYRAQMLVFGFLPIGWQAIVISRPEARDGARLLRDNGYGPLIKRWDHWIVVRPDPSGEGTLYTDRVHIEAGVLTPLIAAYARFFYAHRQKRWRALARSSFSALSA